MPFITAAGLHALDNYQYVSGGYSPFDNFVNPFWEWCVTLLPLWLAPNLVTAIGTITCVIIHAVVAMYSTHFTEEMPWWVHITAAVCVLFYNTMDSIDGKQARRTKASSPLGQLFDHGCDGLQTLVITLSLIATLQLGMTLTTLLFIFSVQIPFFLAQWEEYHTHTMRTHLGWFGVTEGQYLTAFLFLTKPFLPIGFWNSEALLGITFNQILCGGFMLAPGSMTVSFLLNTFSKASSKVTAAAQLFPVAVNAAAMSILFALDGKAGFVPHFSPNPRLAFSAFMLLNVHLITIIIVMNLARQPFPCLPTVLLAPAGVVANAFCGVLPSNWALWLMLVFVLLSYLNFATDCIETICRHRNIYCFKLGPRAPEDNKPKAA